MKYDPDALPFWEVEKGGPVTDSVESRERLRVSRRRARHLRELDLEIKDELTYHADNQRMAALYHLERERQALIGEGNRECNRCGKVAPEESFSPTGCFTGWCRPCILARRVRLSMGEA